jgi:hypothetical protein
MRVKEKPMQVVLPWLKDSFRAIPWTEKVRSTAARHSTQQAENWLSYPLEPSYIPAVLPAVGL